MNKADLCSAYQEVIAGTAVLLDVRHDWEREEEGFEKRSLHIDYDDFVEGKLPKIPKEQQIYVHCKAGGRAGVVKTVLKAHGFKNVENLGGYDDWLDASKG